ncbi:MAG: hypothetical protein ACKOPR_10175 [Chakrabartia godavariana]
MRKLLPTALILASISTANVAAQQRAVATVSDTYKYADLADLALAAPVTAHVIIRQAKRLPKELSVGVRPGFARQLVTADVIALIRASAEVPPRVTYLVDTPVDSRGKTQKLRKSESLIFAAAAGPGQLRLIAPDAQISWSPTAAQTVRGILSEAARPDAAPAIRGISSAFHSPGSIPGEGETQIFLASPENKPLSLTVQRRAGEVPRWFVSQGEVVDEGTSQPRPGSLLWYRIACSLPSNLPNAALDGQAPDVAAALTADYQLVLDGLGRCARTRTSG